MAEQQKVQDWVLNVQNMLKKAETTKKLNKGGNSLLFYFPEGTTKITLASGECAEVGMHWWNGRSWYCNRESDCPMCHDEQHRATTSVRYMMYARIEELPANYGGRYKVGDIVQVLLTTQLLSAISQTAAVAPIIGEVESYPILVTKTSAKGGSANVTYTANVDAFHPVPAVPADIVKGLPPLRADYDKEAMEYAL